MSVVQVAALLGSLASSVAAHGYVSGIIADGTFYTGYNPSFQYQQTEPISPGWQDPADQSNGFIAPSNYTSPDIICHLSATNANSHAVVSAGGVVEFQWTQWPDSHHGPVITYLANCGDTPCESVDKTTLEFFKIDAVGLVDDSAQPGTWGTDQLIANNNSWVVNIPSSIAAGNYVARHEIIALHSAGQEDGAQNYPQCINFQVTGGGSDKPEGVLGTKLYTPTDAGISINIYQSLSTYAIPGPSKIAGATEASQTAVAIKNYGEGATGSGSAVQAVATPTGYASSSAAASSYAAPSTSEAAPETASTSSYAAPTSSVASQEITSVSSYAAPTSEAESSYAAPSSSIESPETTAASSYVAPSSAALTSYATTTRAPYSAPAYSAPLGNLTAGIPTSLLTSTLPTAVPTSKPAGYGNAPLPNTPLPKGLTFDQLLKWVHYLFSEYSSEHGQSQSGAGYPGSNNKYNYHPRDMGIKVPSA